MIDRFRKAFTTPPTIDDGGLGCTANQLLALFKIIGQRKEMYRRNQGNRWLSSTGGKEIDTVKAKEVFLSENLSAKSETLIL
jgi:hypothetical protein